MIIGLLGYGTVGSGVDELVKSQDRPDWRVKKVLSRTVKEPFRDRAVRDIREITEDPEIDTVVECMGGLSPAREYITAALSAGKNVVTSNKAVLAAYYRELTETARENKVSFRASASVGGGIPWLSNLEALEKTERILSLSGIMNGTTNFILSRMEASVRKQQPVSFEAVLKEAQALGYAEADPSADIDGIDVRRKLCISMNVAFQAVFSEEEIPAFGIRTVRERDFLEARKLGCTIRLMGRADREGVTNDTPEPSSGRSCCGCQGNDAVRAEAIVLPCFVKEGSHEAAVTENGNLFSAVTDRTGLLRFAGAGAGKYPTAGNVLRDLARISQGYGDFCVNRFGKGTLLFSESPKRYYLRTDLPSAYIGSLTEKTLSDGAVITRPVTRKDFLKSMETMVKEDPTLFFAELSE